MSIVARLLVG